jgi:hypothetical protein
MPAAPGFTQAPGGLVQLCVTALDIDIERVNGPQVAKLSVRICPSVWADESMVDVLSSKDSTGRILVKSLDCGEANLILGGGSWVWECAGRRCL